MSYHSEYDIREAMRKYRVSRPVAVTILNDQKRLHPTPNGDDNVSSFISGMIAEAAIESVIDAVSDSSSYSAPDFSGGGGDFGGGGASGDW